LSDWGRALRRAAGLVHLRSTRHQALFPSS
jgi:hypothetical protein